MILNHILNKRILRIIASITFELYIDLNLTWTPKLTLKYTHTMYNFRLLDDSEQA